MAVAAKSEYTYRDLCDFARRFNQDSLLTVIARTAAALPLEGPANPVYRRTPPWALAALAKAAIVNGNPHRTRQATAADVLHGCAIYSNIPPREMSDPALATIFNLLVRMAYEQFPYQQQSLEDLARVQALFAGYSGRKRLEALDEAAVSELLGAPAGVAVGVAIMLTVIARFNGGFIDPALFDREDFAEVLKELPL